MIVPGGISTARPIRFSVPIGSPVGTRSKNGNACGCPRAHPPDLEVLVRSTKARATFRGDSWWHGYLRELKHRVGSGSVSGLDSGLCLLFGGCPLLAALLRWQQPASRTATSYHEPSH